MLDAGHALDAADRFLTRGRPHADQRDQGGEEGQAEQGQHDLVRHLRQEGPQASHRHGNEQPCQAKQHPRARPQPLELKCPLAETNLPLEGSLQRGR